MWRVSSFLSLDRLRSSSFKTSDFAMELPLVTGELQYQNQQQPTQQHLKIQDVSDTKQQSNLSKGDIYVKMVASYLPPIDLQSTPLLWWNILVIFLITYNLIQIPIVVLIVDYAVDETFFSQSFYYYDISMLIVFISDMLFVRWRVSFYQKERKNTNQLDVFYRYWKQYFPFDFISTLGLLLFLTIKTTSYIKLICYARIFSVWNIDVEIRNKIEMNSMWLGIYKFIRQMVFIFFVLSLGSCIYFFIDYSIYLQKDFFYEHHLLWLTGSGAVQDMNIFQNFPWYVWYQYALYLLLQTSRGVGYGDITPMNPVEAFYIVLVILINQWIFTLFANGILQIVEEIKDNQIEKNHSILNKGFWTYRLSYKVKEKSRKYVDSKNRNAFEQHEDFFLPLLSDNLKKDFQLNFHRQFWDNFEILNLLFTTDDHLWTLFSRELISTLKCKYFSEGDYIIQRNEENHLKLALISRGRIKESNSIVNFEKKYTNLTYIGQRSFFFNNKATTDFRCESFTKIYYFEKEPFFRIIKKYPQQLEIFSHYFDKVKINKQSAQMFHLNCCICDESHLEEFCLINEAWKSKQISSYQSESPEYKQQRKRYVRKKYLLEKQEGLFIKREFLETIDTDKCQLYSRYNPQFNIDSLANF